MIGLAKTAIFCLLGLFLIACKKEGSIPVSYSPVARPDAPVAFFAVINGIKPVPGIETAVHGVGTIGPFDGGGVGFGAPIEYGDSGRLEWTITWLETRTLRGWEESFVIKTRDFPEYLSPPDGPFARAYEKRTGKPLPRGYDFLLRFEAGGALTVWTAGPELASGLHDGPPEWEDYVMLGQLCGRPVSGLPERGAFVEAEAFIEAELEMNAPTPAEESSPNVIDCKN